MSHSSVRHWLWQTLSSGCKVAEPGSSKNFQSIRVKVLDGAGQVGAKSLSFRTVMACALVLDVRNWLWHLTMNTGELKKCERRHFTDWHWAQFEQADLLPGPVEFPSNSNYWLYTTANPDQKSGEFEFRRNLARVGQVRLSWACFCIEQEAEYLTWKQAIEKFRSDSLDYFETRSPPAVPESCPWIAAVEITPLADYERRWMWEFHTFYVWYLIDKMSEDGWS